MNWMNAAFSYVLHLNAHLQQLCQHDGPWVYGTLFVLILAEATPLGMLFLPCDTLLFVSGTLTATGMLDATLLLPTLVAAAVLGDSGNYWLGRLVGRRLFGDPEAKVFRREYLDRTDRFFTRHGRKTIVIARFLPTLRTYVPFAAGAVHTPYRRFLAASALGASSWVVAFVLGGQWLGNLPVVQQSFSPAMLGLAGISLWPMLAMVMRWRPWKTRNGGASSGLTGC